MRDTDRQKQLDKLLVEQSSELLEAAKHGGEQEQRALAEWLSQSKRHVRTYLFMTALDEELNRIDPQRRIPIPDVLAGGGTTVTPLPSRTQSPERAKAPWKWLAAAMVVMAVSIPLVWSLVQRHSGWQELTTATGEQRAVQLADGSIVQLNTRSRVQTRLSERSRDIRLLEGEAFFKVAKDPARPFNVYTSDATIVAVGTQFNVYRQHGQTTVSVIEGRVKVLTGADSSPSATTTRATSSPETPLLLAAGDEAEVRQGTQIERRQTADVTASAAWVQRRLVFKQEPLANVVLQFNRYRDTPQFVVEDPELAQRRYSGVFDVDDPQSLQDVLATQRDVTVELKGDVIAIRKRP